MSDYKLVLEHHGILGQKWGVRRFQNADGTRTAAGKKRYMDSVASDHKRIQTADKALSKLQTNDTTANRLKAGKAVLDLKKNKVEQARLKTYDTKNNKKFKALEVGSKEDGWEVYGGYNIGPGKATKALRKAHVIPKNEHGQYDNLKNEFNKESKQLSKSNLDYHKTKLSEIDKKSPEYLAAKSAVDQARRDYKSIRRGNKLRVGVSRPGLFPNMRADSVQNAYDTYRRRGYSPTDAAYAAYGNIAVKKYVTAGMYTTTMS